MYSFEFDKMVTGVNCGMYCGINLLGGPGLLRPWSSCRLLPWLNVFRLNISSCPYRQRLYPVHSPCPATCTLLMHSSAPLSVNFLQQTLYSLFWFVMKGPALKAASSNRCTGHWSDTKVFLVLPYTFWQLPRFLNCDGTP